MEQKRYPCETCMFRAHYDKNPKSILGRLWYWHISFCPGWKAYFTHQDEKTKAELRSKYDFRKYSGQVIKDTDKDNGSMSDRTSHIEEINKYSVDAFVKRVRSMAVSPTDLKVYQTLSFDHEARTVIEIPGSLKEMDGVNKIVVNSDRKKEHIEWIYLYGEVERNFLFAETVNKAEESIPRLLLGEYSVFLKDIDQEDDLLKLQYRVIENRLSQNEKDAFRYFIAHLKKEYEGLFRLDIEDVFNDVFVADSIVNEPPSYDSILANLPARFKEDFSKRLINIIPLSKSDLDLDKLTRLFSEIVRRRMITLPFYRHYCVILNLLNSELRKYIKHDNVNQLTGTCDLYIDEEPIYSERGEIELDSFEGKGRKGHTLITVDENKLRGHIVEECSYLLDDLSNPDFNSSFLAKEPLEESLWWGEIGADSYSPVLPNELNEGGIRHIFIEYSIKEKIPSNSYIDHSPTSHTTSEKGLDRFKDQLRKELSIEESKATIITDNKNPDGCITSIIDLPNLKHYYRRITLTYHDEEHIESIKLSGVKLLEVADSFSESFLGFPVTMITRRSDELVFKVLY